MLPLLHAVAHVGLLAGVLLHFVGLASNRPLLAVFGFAVALIGVVALIARDCLLASVPVGSEADVSRRWPRFWPHPAERFYGPYISVRWGVGLWLVVCVGAYVYARAGGSLGCVACCMLIPQAFIIFVLIPWLAGRAARASDRPAVPGPEDGP